MYSGTGVCAGHAHWQSTTLWKWVGVVRSVGLTALPPPARRFEAAQALAFSLSVIMGGRGAGDNSTRAKIDAI
jgi:hypothetical protein